MKRILEKIRRWYYAIEDDQLARRLSQGNSPGKDRDNDGRGEGENPLFVGSNFGIDIFQDNDTVKERL